VAHVIVSAFIKLQRAKQILEQELGGQIKAMYFEPKLARVRAAMQDNTYIYVLYNDHDEYSYSLIFTIKNLDRVRCDNHDDRWEVPTRPNHFHPRFNKNGYSSPMHGNPDYDLPKFCGLVKNGDFWGEDFRFT